MLNNTIFSNNEYSLTNAILRIFISVKEFVPNLRKNQLSYISYVSLIISPYYHEDLEKRGGCGVVVHERHESHVSQ